MFVILSQRIDFLSEYNDKPYEIYHYPETYKNQLKSGDIFIYYQGDRKKKANRYYYGCGVIGEITKVESEDGNDFYAEVLLGIPFHRKVPIYNDINSFYEKEGKDPEAPSPAWQRSVRATNRKAFEIILNKGGLDPLIVSELFTIKFEQNLLKEELNKLKNQLTGIF